MSFTLITIAGKSYNSEASLSCCRKYSNTVVTRYLTPLQVQWQSCSSKGSCGISCLSLDRGIPAQKERTGLVRSLYNRCGKMRPRCLHYSKKKKCKDTANTSLNKTDLENVILEIKSIVPRETMAGCSNPNNNEIHSTKSTFRVTSPTACTIILFKMPYMRFYLWTWST
jgi:hypothetical protein